MPIGCTGDKVEATIYIVAGDTKELTDKFPFCLQSDDLSQSTLKIGETTIDISGLPVTDGKKKGKAYSYTLKIEDPSTKYLDETNKYLN